MSQSRNHAHDALESLSGQNLMVALTAISPSELGARIKQNRVRQGLTQTEVATAAAVEQPISVPQLSRIERGARKPSLRPLLAIASALRVSPHDLLAPATPGWAELSYAIADARLRLEKGEGETALRLSEDLLERVPQGSELHRTALEVHARSLEACGDYEGAASSLEMLLKEPDVGARLEVMTVLARCYRQAGDYVSACGVGQRADEIIDALGLEGTEDAISLKLTVAGALIDAGQLAQARAQCDDAGRWAEELKSPATLAKCFWEASIVEKERGRKTEALALITKAIRIVEQENQARHAARMKIQNGLVLVMMEPADPEGGLALLKQADLALQSVECSPADRGWCRYGQALAHFLIGDLFHAEGVASDALRHFAEGAPIITAALETLLGRIALRREDKSAARAFYLRAVHTLYAAGDDRRVARSWWELGGLLREAGCTEEALDAFSRGATSTGWRDLASETITPADDANAGTSIRR